MKNQISIITQYFPASYLGKHTYKIIDGKIFSTWRNIFSLYETSFDLKDFNSQYSTGHREFDDWGNLAWFFLVVFIVISWFKIFDIYSFIALIISLFFFLMKLKKYDWVYFYDKNHINCIQIRLPDNDDQRRKDVEDFVKNLEKEIIKFQRN